MRARAIAVLLCAAAACARAPADPVRLTLTQASDVAGHAYAAEMVQSITFALPTGTQRGEREYRIRFTFADAQPAAADSVDVTARLDSVRAIMSSPHGRQVVDTRTLLGRTFPLRYARSGGAPSYTASPPAADFGMFGGAFPVSIMVDFLFPRMPDQPVQVGDGWERVHVRRQVDGGSVLTEGNITSRYKLAGYENHDGVRLARLEVASSGDIGEVGAQGSGSTGRLESTGFILLGTLDGSVREASMEESVTISMATGSAHGTRRQTTNYRITSIGRGD
jgi:hypothetical protein